MDRILIGKVEICFGGYNLDRLEKKTLFIVQKSVEQGIRNYFANTCVDISEIVVGYDVDKLTGIIVSFFSSGSQDTLLSVISKEGVRDSIVKNIGGVFRDNFGSVPKRISFEFRDETKLVENGTDEEDESIEGLASRYKPVEPFYTFDNLIIGKQTLEEIEIALTVLEHSDLVFEKWELKKIEPFPRSVLNFYGPPGTGKTMAAHAIASRLGKKILLVGCPEIQSKYHGESSKNVKAVFYAAEKSDAVLFFDESDSMLSRRLEEVNTGAEDEINNMRNTMLMCLEMHRGIVIFASNFVKRYDYAFETRVQSVLFPIPDLDTLEKIWQKHLLPAIEIQGTIDLHGLAEKTLGFCGRDVKNAVVKSCFTAIHSGHMYVTEQDILDACRRIKETREDLRHADYSRVNIAVPEDKPKTYSVREIISLKESNWEKTYLAAVPCDAAMNIGSIVKAAWRLNDSEIRKAVECACYHAYESGAETVSEESLLDAIKLVEADSASKRENKTDGNEIQALQEGLEKLIKSRTIDK